VGSAFRPLWGRDGLVCLGTRVPNKRFVRVREGGEVLEAIDLDLLLHLRARGPEGRTLFLIATEWNRPANMVRVADGPGAHRSSRTGGRWPWKLHLLAP
jgi:hypothetical protein